MIKTYTDKIELQPNHSYYHEVLGNLKSVTTILNNGKQTEYTNEAMEQGSKVHKVIDFYLKGNEEEAKNIFNELNSSYQTKLVALMEAIKKLILKDSFTELSFATHDTENDIKYAGTVDLLTKDYVIDFKTGSLTNKYFLQIAAYAIANKRKEGIIFSFNKENQLEKTLVNIAEIEKYYKEFINQAKCVFNITDSFDKDLLTMLKDYNDLKTNISDLEKQLNEQKDIIQSKINEQGYNKYKVSNFCCYIQQGRTNKTLTKEAKDILLSEHPEYFKTTTTNPTFIIKSSNKEEK